MKVSDLKIKQGTLKRMQARLKSIDAQIAQHDTILRAILSDAGRVQHDTLRLQDVIDSLSAVRPQLSREIAALQTKIDAVQRKM